MLVIGLGHKARQGKNTVARMMVKEFGKLDLYAKDYAFSDALYSVARVMFRMNDKNTTLLQTLGTNIFRHHVDEEIWPNTLGYKLYEDKPDVAIITDVRFENEVTFIRSFDWSATVKVTRINQETGRQFITEDRDPNHPSETALNKHQFDYDLITDNLHDLEILVHDLVTLELLPRIRQ